MTRTIDPIVTADWLQTELQLPDRGDLTVIDLRWAEEYAAGHIPGAISVPFGLQSVWAESGGDYLLELPPDDELFKLIGDCGLTADSRVVMVGRVEEPPAPQYALADPARAAATLMYAGVRNVAVLSGGHPAWERAGGETTTDVPTITPTTYRPEASAVDRATWVSTDYVKEHIGTRRAHRREGPRPVLRRLHRPLRRHARAHPHRPQPAHGLGVGEGRHLPAGRPDRGDGGRGHRRGQGPGDHHLLRRRGLREHLVVPAHAAPGLRDVKIYDGSMEAWVDLKNPLVQYSWCS